MDRHIIGTFREEEAVIKEINRLINNEGYSPEELMVVIDNDHEYEEKLNTLKQVEINQIDVEDSVWEKIKDTFSFGSYNKKEEMETLENYGVPHERSKHYMDALEDGEIILLANSDAPANNELSQVNNEVVEEDERMIKMDKNNKPIDEVNTEEEEAIKNKDTENDTEKDENKPSNVNTSEIDEENMTDSMDPGQANSTRSEENTSKPEEDEPTNDEEQQSENGDMQWSNSEEKPDLTGEEESVDKEETKHNYGNTVAEGVVKPDAKSPLNTDVKEEKDPSEESETPESDANYPESQEDAGMKSEE